MELFLHGFLKIAKESIKLVPKNGKIMASITMLSLLLPSLLFLLALYSHKFLTKMLDGAIEETPNPNHFIIYFFALLLVSVAASLFVTALSSSLSISSTAVILVSAMSYTGKKATLQGLLARMINNYPRQLRLSSPANAPRWRNPTLILVLIAATSFAYSVAIDHHGAITHAVNSVVVGITISNSLRYTCVVGNLGAVVSVVEERREAVMVMEKAEELVVGHRMQGAMVNLFVNLFPVWHVLLGYWMVWRNECYLKLSSNIRCALPQQCVSGTDLSSP